MRNRGNRNKPLKPSTAGSLTMGHAACGRDRVRVSTIRCRTARVDVPQALDTWWFVDRTPLLMARSMKRTPPELACVGIWLDKCAFETA